jgi:hypothetical protein
MLDRYAQGALECYGRLRRLDPAETRAELDRLDSLLANEGAPDGTSGPPNTGPAAGEHCGTRFHNPGRHTVPLGPARQAIRR